MQASEVLGSVVEPEAMQRAGAAGVQGFEQLRILHRLALGFLAVAVLLIPVFQQGSPHLLVGHLLDLLAWQTNFAGRDVPPTLRDDGGLGHVGGDVCRADIATLPMIEQFGGRERRKLDVRTAASHVGGDHDGAEFTGMLDDLGLPLMLFGIEHFMLDRETPLEIIRDILGVLNTRRADQDRTADVVESGDLFNDRIGLVLDREVYDIIVVAADHRNICRNHHDIEAVDLVELGRFGISGTGHSGEPLIELEEVLNRDRRHGLRLFLDGDAFLGLDGLMQTI